MFNPPSWHEQHFIECCNLFYQVETLELWLNYSVIYRDRWAHGLIELSSESIRFFIDLFLILVPVVAHHQGHLQKSQYHTPFQLLIIKMIFLLIFLDFVAARWMLSAALWAILSFLESKLRDWRIHYFLLN